MAVIFEEQLKKYVQKNSLLPVYVLFGEDGYLKKLYTNKIAKLVADEEDIFNFAQFDSQSDLQEVYDFAMQQPLMADKKYAELCDFDFEHCSKSELDKLCELLSEIPESCVFVLRFQNFNFDTKRNTKWNKIVESAEKNGGIAACLDHRRQAELVKMLEDGAKKRGCSFSAGAAKYLVETVGEDINILSFELSKLCSFSKDTPITKQTVDEVCVKTVEASIYNLSKFILNCDTSSAISCLDELFYTRTEPMSVLYTVASSFCDIYRVFTAKQNGETTASISKIFSYKNKEFLLDKALNYLSKFDAKKLNLCLTAIYNADNALKSFGADARIILEQLIIRLIYIIAKGENID